MGTQQDLNIEIRNEGKYWTPEIWAKQAHKQLAESFGDDWMSKYVVWDPCCGGGALTAGVEIEHLIQTTLKKEDVEYCGGPVDTPNHYLSNLDLLNNFSVHPSILKMLNDSGKPLLFLMNPPYIAPGNLDRKINTVKSGTGATFVRAFMGDDLNYVARQLYVQFVWRCIEIATREGVPWSVCMFSPLSYLTRTSFKPFRDFIFERGRYMGGFLFQSTEFENITTDWPVGVACFTQGGSYHSNKFPFKVYENIEGSIIDRGYKVMYNVSKGATINHWLKSRRPHPSYVTVPAMRNGLKQAGDKVFQIQADSFGSLSYSGASTQYREQIYIVSAGINGGRYIPINDSNLPQVCSFLAAMRCLKRTWLNDKDFMQVPRRECDEFSANSIVFTCISPQNNACAGTLKTKQGKFRLRNHFVPWPRHIMEREFPSLNYGEPEGKEIMRDYRNGYTIAASVIHDYSKEHIWPESWELLDAYLKMLHDILPGRIFPGHRHWDAGFFQLHSLLKTSELYEKEFKPARTRLKRRLFGRILDLGFFGDYDGALQFKS